MTETVHISDEAGLVAAVAAAVADGATLDVAGRGTKRGIGRAAPAARRLDLSALSGVTLYEPEELVFSARAGTAVRDIQAMLAQHRQMLAFEPMDT
ncbi:MAG: FAD-binding protein, partial [Rhizobiales bacterium]|nr:FAD-binding protein [Hyphomicrobiales bacterium]